MQTADTCFLPNQQNFIESRSTSVMQTPVSNADTCQLLIAEIDLSFFKVNKKPSVDSISLMFPACTTLSQIG